MASQEGHTVVVDLLLRAKADVNQATKVIALHVCQAIYNHA